MDEPIIDPDIPRFSSTEWREHDRLRSGLHGIELVRTQEIVRRFLPNGSLRVLDVGGGSGVHAEWLLDDGHSVHLVDPVRRHVDQAEELFGRRREFTSEVGVAQALSQRNGSVDAVLLFGPLYHLIDEDDRRRAWSAALRVTKPGGLLFATAISRFASLAEGLGRGLIFDTDFEAMVRRTLSDGQHRNPEGRDFFTTAFCHRPEQLREEAELAGWTVTALLGLEGFTLAMPDLEDDWKDPARLANILDMARAIESERSLLGLSAHTMLVARTAS